MSYGRLFNAGGKYSNVKVEYDGQKFDSKREFARYNGLVLLQRAGLIKDLQRQVKYELIPKQDGEKAVYYIADFVYTENGQLVVEDCKGFRTDVYKLKRKLMKWRYGYTIRET